MKKLEKPTIFNSLEEIDEAVKSGYLDGYYGYKKRGPNEYNFPTMFWNLPDFTITHQPKITFVCNNEWKTYNFIDIYNKAIQWTDIDLLSKFPNREYVEELTINIPEELSGILGKKQSTTIKKLKYFDATFEAQYYNYKKLYEQGYDVTWKLAEKFLEPKEAIKKMLNGEELICIEECGKYVVKYFAGQFIYEQDDSVLTCFDTLKEIR